MEAYFITTKSIEKLITLQFESCRPSPYRADFYASSLRRSNLTGKPYTTGFTSKAEAELSFELYCSFVILDTNMVNTGGHGS